MSVYYKENPEFLDKALCSLVNQSLMPSEITLVKDGKLTDELEEVISQYCLKYSDLFKIIPLKENVGLGKALNAGLLHCTNEIVARMDSDDICDKKRFEKQLNFITKNIDIDIVGSWITEFSKEESNIIGKRKVPENNDKIRKKFKYKNSLNHVTVIFKKSKVIAAGNYMDQPYFEDYYLWIRMLMKGCRFYNLQESLVLVRAGEDMIGRRHGMEYAKKEFNNFLMLYKINFINKKELLKLLIIRLPLRLFPKRIILFVYNKVLRSR